MSNQPLTKKSSLQSYYQWHAHIYDITRWSFLFGRNTLIKSLPGLPGDAHILDVGCGTGHNLVKLRVAFPDAQITGIDLSPAMLEIASKKTDPETHLINSSYENLLTPDIPYDLILLSYSLTMMQASPSKIISQLYNNLSKGGVIALVDFYTTPFKWFRRWMGKNHVTMDKTTYSILKKHFRTVRYINHNAYMGLWSYYIFIGRT